LQGVNTQQGVNTLQGVNTQQGVNTLQAVAGTKNVKFITAMHSTIYS